MKAIRTIDDVRRYRVEHPEARIVMRGALGRNWIGVGLESDRPTRIAPIGDALAVRLFRARLLVDRGPAPGGGRVYDLQDQ